MRRVGPTTWWRNCVGDSTPAQLSNSITVSAPASIWAERYSTVTSSSNAMMRPNSSGCAWAMVRVAAKSREPEPSTM